jgi:Ig-like domain CHU_C associated/Secretion system C-terminal sorting domain
MKTLLFLLLPFLAFPQCPLITQQPQSQADCDGNSIRMIVESNGTTFQWEKKRPQDASFSNITGATQANYQIMPTGNSSNPTGTQYRVKVGIGSCYLHSDHASIQLRKINSILNPAICERGNGVLESIQTEGATHYQWMRSIHGGPFVDMSDDIQFQGTQQNQLQIIQATTNLDGQKFKIRVDFIVSANNDNEGSTQNLNQTLTCPRTSSEITLQIKATPTPRHAANSYSGCINQAFPVNATGCSPYTTQWYDEQHNLIGTGARLLVTLPDESPHRYFATCMNAGCESLVSSGTQAQAFPKPNPPQNAGTLSEICPGLSVTFKASGGVNNIWYLNTSSTAPLSTATTYTTSANPASSPFTRYVSQKINGCESDRTAILVQVLSLAVCSPTDSTSTPPPIVNPPPTDSTEQNLPQVHLSYQLHQNCESGTYALNIHGCHLATQITINRQATLVSNYFESYIPENTELHITCPESISDPLDILLPGLTPPEIPIQSNYQNYVCEGDKTSLSIQLPIGAHMVGWEYNGHLFTQTKDLHETLAAGNYQAIIQRNTCTYRSESIYIDVHPKPEIPKLINTRTNICIGDTIYLQTTVAYPYYLWSNQSTAATFVESAKQAGNLDIVAQVSMDGTCWSNPSETIHIQVNPSPEKPQILVQKNGGFCRGDSILLSLNHTGMAYKWSNNEINQRIYAYKPERYEAIWQDSMGCWSPPSEAVQTYYYPEEPQPHIHALNRQFCQGESVTIYASPAFEYRWSTQANSDSIVLRTSDIIYLKTQNEYGCLSPPSLPLQIIAQGNPWMPKLSRSGMYFIQATNIEPVTKYEWKLDSHLLKDTTAQIKIRQSGFFQVRAIKKYELRDAIPIQCYSPYQVSSFGISADDPGIRLYPNPNKGELVQVEIQEDLSNVDVALYSLQGKQLKRWQLSDTRLAHSLQLEQIPTGSYVLQFYAQQWSREKRIFIVSD